MPRPAKNRLATMQPYLLRPVPYDGPRLNAGFGRDHYSLDFVGLADMTILKDWYEEMFPGKELPPFEETDELSAAVDHMQALLLRDHGFPLMRLDICDAHETAPLSSYYTVCTGDYAVSLTIPPFKLEVDALPKKWLDICFTYLFTFPEIKRIVIHLDSPDPGIEAILTFLKFSDLPVPAGKAFILTPP